MTVLTGIDPNSPTPSILREFFFAQGEANGPSGTRDVLFYGNITTAGSETVDTLGEAIVDESDIVARAGRRSEVFAMWRAFNLIPQQATQYFIAVTESVGGAAAQAFTVGGTVGVGGAIEVKTQGETFQVPIYETDADTDEIATRLALFINNAANGQLQMTAAETLSVVACTAAQKGPRGDLLFGDATHGMRMRIVGNTAVTITKGALTAGTTDDDNTNALAAAAAGEFYYQVSSCHATAGVTTNDGGIGEASAFINTGLAPINGKQQTIHFGLVGTHAEMQLVTNSVNLVTSFFWHAEDNDWTPAMIASHNMAVMRSKELSHPGANLADYTNGTGTPYFMPSATLAADVPTPTQIDQALNNGASPIGFRGVGRKPYIVRHVTNMHQNDTGDDEYRARPGHVPSVTFFCWETFYTRWVASKQPFTGPDPQDNQSPMPATSTPDSVRSIFRSIVNEFTRGRPLGYLGPILNPADIDAMKASIYVEPMAGGFGGTADWSPVQHNYFLRIKARQIGAAY